MKIDIDRLHAVYTQALTGKRAGHTTAMLIEAAQLADFNGGPVLIIGSNPERLASEFWEVATSLHFGSMMLRRSGTCCVIIGIKQYFFRKAATKGQQVTRTYWDEERS